MSILRRTLAVAALTLAVSVAAIAATLPAWASWSDSAPVPTTTYSTTTVAAPTITASNLACTTPNATMSLSWQKSSTPQVANYIVVVYYSDNTMQTYTVPATATSWSQSVSTYNVTVNAVTYSVETVTTYNWVKQSAYTAWYRC